MFDVHLTSVAFAYTGIHDLSDTHLASRWQVHTADDFVGELTYDSGVTTVDLLAHTVPDVLSLDVTLYARVAHQDGLEEWSEWSDPIELLLPRRTLERAWAFTFDGHVFYVLNRAYEPSFVYDMTTQQWHHWLGQEVLESEGAEPFWNMFRGVVWKGRVLACGMWDNMIWELDPHSMLDEEIIPIKRKVTGFQPLRGSASQRQGALRVTARKEDAAEPAILTMRFSDDGGKTWSAPRTVDLFGSHRIEFRSLGRIRAPGRIWEISDEGGFVRIDGADADLEGEE